MDGKTWFLKNGGVIIGFSTLQEIVLLSFIPIWVRIDRLPQHLLSHLTQSYMALYIKGTSKLSINMDLNKYIYIYNYIYIIYKSHYIYIYIYIPSTGLSSMFPMEKSCHEKRAASSISSARWRLWSLCGFIRKSLGQCDSRHLFIQNPIWLWGAYDILWHLLSEESNII